MLPIRDDNPTHLTPFVTIALIVLNGLSWALLQAFGAEPGLSASVCQYGLIPVDLLGEGGAGAPRFCPTQLGGNNLTLLSSMFMHGGWLHLLGNLWFLWIFGNNVEDSMGHARFLVFYLLCGVAAAAAQIAAGPDSAIPMVGASGAIGGVMGAYIVLFPKVHVHMLVFLGFFVTTFAVPAIVMLGYWMLLQLVGGFGSLGQDGGGVAFWAHVGGFAAGAALIWVFRNPQLLAAHPYHGWRQKQSPTKSWRKINYK